MAELPTCGASVRLCPSTLRREALLHLAAVHEPALQSALHEALQQARQAAWRGLWIAEHQGRITGALWVQPLDHATAQLWLPLKQSPASLALLQTARTFVAENSLTLCHVVLPPSHYAWETALLDLGMIRLAALRHMAVKLGGQADTCQPAVSIRLEPFEALNASAQHALLDLISQGSLDSPALYDALGAEALLAGFHQRAPAAPRHWYSVNVGIERVGVLLLAPGAEWELLLMGVAPRWRGRGIGRAVLIAALRMACEAGAPELLLTVDANNAPARHLYAQAGFDCHAEQRLLAWRN
ncbi:GNAT family N-acetyltransferase [Halomonas aquamarina]|uniref:GNAT family N-acetyltransferase n=1 Tax=Vreelandella aquamarina TaxID=77097 RepID=A0ACC5VTJ0_9GAMM|nr:GNAT family N-acetyltransferase [Halomonas aquamarina]MBZ5487462.1 GNAT family N-acetyltransferase [Halomonas aquamarina]